MDSALLKQCPICRVDADPCYQGGEHRLYRCQACGTAFVDPMPTAETLARFYAAFHLDEDAGGCYDRFDTRMQADFPRKVDLIQRIAGRTPGRLLDVGCGKGFFVKACTERGIEAEGVDLSTSGVEYATSRLSVKAVQGRLQDVGAALGTFDVVTFWATIEHLADPAEMLSAIHERLKPGGYLFLDTGIGDDWLDRLLPGVTQWYDPPQHLFVFSGGGLERLLADTGFELIELDRCFDRSALRRAVRMARSGVTGAALRAAATLGRLHCGTFGFTRFPIGNLMLGVARKRKNSDVAT